MSDDSLPYHTQGKDADRSSRSSGISSPSTSQSSSPESPSRERFDSLTKLEFSKDEDDEDDATALLLPLASSHRSRSKRSRSNNKSRLPRALAAASGRVTPKCRRYLFLAVCLTAALSLVLLERRGIRTQLTSGGSVTPPLPPFGGTSEPSSSTGSPSSPSLETYEEEGHFHSLIDQLEKLRQNLLGKGRPTSSSSPPGRILSESQILPLHLHHSTRPRPFSAPSESSRRRRKLEPILSQSPLMDSEACSELWFKSGEVCQGLNLDPTSKEEEQRGPGNRKTSEIDIVYTWVNGSDWRHESAKWMYTFRPEGRWDDFQVAEEGEEKQDREDVVRKRDPTERTTVNGSFRKRIDASSLGGRGRRSTTTPTKNRFNDNGELKYSIRSAFRYLGDNLGTVHVISPDYAAPLEIQPESVKQRYAVGPPSPPRETNFGGRSRKLENELEAGSSVAPRRQVGKTTLERLSQGFKGIPSKVGLLQKSWNDFFFTSQDEQAMLRQGQIPSWLETRAEGVAVGRQASSSSSSSSSSLSPKASLQDESQTRKATKTRIRFHHDWNVFRSNWLVRPGSSDLEVEEEYKSHSLPTFNSMAVEAMLGDEPGLSEHFIYSNDDFFFLSDLSTSDFYSPLYGPVLRMDANLLVTGDPQPSQGGEGEWPALFRSAHLLDQRFGRRKRPYVAHVQRSLSKPLLLEMRMVWAKEFHLSGLERFRGRGPSLATQFLAYHFVIERHREALLWSFFLLKLDGDADGLVQEAEYLNALIEMGLGKDPEAVRTILASAGSRARGRGRSTSILSVPVRMAERESLGPKVVSENLARSGWVEPKATEYRFTSQDGYPLAKLTPFAQNRLDPSRSRWGVGVDSDSTLGGSSSISFVEEPWPNFVKDRQNLHRFQDETARPACYLDLGECFVRRFEFEEGMTPAWKWEEVFKHFAFERKECGDCLIHHLVRRSGRRGLEAFLPPPEPERRGGKEETIRDPQAPEPLPHLPLSKSWIPRPSEGEEDQTESPDFSRSNVFRISNWQSEFGVDSPREFSKRLIQRYSYVIGDSSTSFVRLETEAGSRTTLGNLGRSGESLVCINDDIRESHRDKVVEMLASFFTTTFPTVTPYEKVE
ncbi:hypothetical protein IE53DRAFT_335873 [Violaceomyces palustris]|uniref:Uncharacterized protein n=1 Tax=Violaceomyces palustris TaxID=1673888 RepID=A0ACD0NMV5_9BASI|nr:hypothetical protein IE53DRAFT_335873 [Violaceomyces palustris]